MKNLNSIIKGLAACLIVVTPLKLQATPYKPVTNETAKPVFKIGNSYTIKGVTYSPSLNDTYDELGIASWYGVEFHGKLTSNGEVFNKDLVTAASTVLPLPSIVEITNLENGKKLLVRVNDRGPYTDGRIIDVSERAAEILGFKNEGTAKVRVKIIPELSKEVAQQMPNYAEVMSSLNSNNKSRPNIISISSEDNPAINNNLQNSNRLTEISSAVISTYDDTAQSNLNNKPNTTLINVDSTRLKQVNLLEPEGIQQYVPRGIFVQVGAFINNNPKIKEDINILSKVGVVTLQNIDVQGKNVLRVRVGPYGSIEDASKIKTSLIQLGYKDPRVVIED